QELRSRIKELEKSKTDTDIDNARCDVEIAEIKAEVVKLVEGAVVKDYNEENKELISLEEETSPTPIVRKIPYNQKVEQGIIQEEGQDLAQLFSDAKVAEGRTLEAKRKELVTEKTAKSQVYAMIKASLSNVSDSNLYKKTERAGSFYKLFGKIIDPATKKEVMGIGINKVYGISYGVRGISELKNSFLSADLDDYINILLGSFDDKTANWDTAYENSARVEKEEVNEVKGPLGS
ncbi:7834_t:CDS:2, partial [Funneliformis geosporum]